MAIFRNYWQIVPDLFGVPEHNGHGYWVWRMADTYCAVEAEERHALEAAGWQSLPFLLPDALDASSVATYIATTQAPVIWLTYVEGPVGWVPNTLGANAWIKTADLQHAERYPVLLGHYEVHNGITAQEISSNPYRQKFQSEGILTGTHALIAGENDFYHIYSLEQLGEEGLRAYETMRADLNGKAYERRWDILIKRKNDVDIVEHQQWIESCTPEIQRGYQSLQQLARLYWELHQKKIADSSPRMLPSIPTVFSNGVSLIPNALAIQGVLTAYSNAQSGGKQWKEHNQRPIYIYQQAKDTAQIDLRPATSTDVTLQSLWEQVSKYNDYDGDVFLAMLAQWMSSQDSAGYAWITSKQILTYRGIQPRKHEETPYDHRNENLATIAESVERIQGTHITLQQWMLESPTGKRGRRKKQVLERQSYVILVEEFLQQRDLDLRYQEEGVSASLPLAWKYKPGNCLDTFLNDSHRQSAWLLKQALSYDPYRNMWEKRLARHFMFQSLSGPTILCQIRQLFRELSLPIDSRNPERTRHRIEQALRRLQQDNMIGDWSYLEQHKLPGRKWIELWLDFTLQVCINVSSPQPKKVKAPGEGSTQ